MSSFLRSGRRKSFKKKRKKLKKTIKYIKEMYSILYIIAEYIYEDYGYIKGRKLKDVVPKYTDMKMGDYEYSIIEFKLRELDGKEKD